MKSQYVNMWCMNSVHWTLVQYWSFDWENGHGAELRRLLLVGPGRLGRFIATARTTRLCQWVAMGSRPENAVKVDQVNRTHYCIVPPTPPPRLTAWCPGVQSPPDRRGGSSKRDGDRLELNKNWTEEKLGRSQKNFVLGHRGFFLVGELKKFSWWKKGLTKVDFT